MLEAIFVKRWKNLQQSPDFPKWVAELDEIQEGLQKEWERIASNLELRSRIRKIQARYNLPIIRSEESGFLRRYHDWIQGTPQEIKYEIDDEIQRVLHDFKLDSIWSGHVSSYIILGTIETLQVIQNWFLRWGLAGIEIDEEYRNVKLSDDAIPSNQIVQEQLFRFRIILNPPPMPTHVPGDSKGRKNWGPLALWNSRHPEINLRELAGITGYEYKYLSRKLSEVRRTQFR